MSAYSREEKDTAFGVYDVREAIGMLADLMRERSWHLQGDEALRTIYQRCERAFTELDAAMHFVARVEAAPEADGLTPRPLETPFHSGE